MTDKPKATDKEGCKPSANPIGAVTKPKPISPSLKHSLEDDNHLMGVSEKTREKAQ